MTTIDTDKIVALLTRLEAMLTIQRGKYTRFCELQGAFPLSPAGREIEARLVSGLRDEITMIEAITDALRDAGVQSDGGTLKSPVEATSGHYGANGEEVAEIRRALGDDPVQCNQADIYDDDDDPVYVQYGCVLSPHGPDVEHMIRPRP